MKTILRLCSFVVTVIILFNGVYAQETQPGDTIPLTLNDAQQHALEYNRDVRSSKIDVEIAKKQVMETTAIGLPQFNIEATYQHQFTVPEMSFGGYYDFTSLDPNTTVTGSDLTGSYILPPPVKLGTADNTTINFKVTQLIFSGEYLVGLQASRVYRELSEKNVVLSELKIKESVSAGYFTVLVLDENIKILEESRQAVDKTLNEITKMHEQGYTEETDVDQLKINLANLETLIHSLEGQIDVSKKLLKIQLGMELTQEIKLIDSIAGIVIEGNEEYLSNPEFALDKSTSYQMLQVQESLMSLSLKRERSKYLPTIAAFYQHQEQLNAPAFNFMPKDVIGVTASIPIFTSGQRIAKVKQAKMELEKATLTKEQVGENLILEFDAALNTYQIAYKNYLSNKESMELSKKIHEKNTIKFKEGIITSLNLTQSQEQYLTTQRNYYSSVMEFFNAKVALDRILEKSTN